MSGINARCCLCYTSTIVCLSISLNYNCLFHCHSSSLLAYPLPVFISLSFSIHQENDELCNTVLFIMNNNNKPACTQSQMGDLTYLYIDKYYAMIIHLLPCHQSTSPLVQGIKLL